ncbi:MAG: hypothetical protein IT304_04450 [Dehalococcoidia bacterium]|nr:hypothetical protein [Dehalococcoidia bacterium]
MAIFSILLTVLMIGGAVVAWRLSKRETVTASRDEQWHDDSLDAWRRQRDVEAAVAREGRANNPSPATPLEGGVNGEEGETKRQQRIGG